MMWEKKNCYYKKTIMNLFQFKEEDENMPMSGIHVLGL